MKRVLLTFILCSALTSCSKSVDKGRVESQCVSTKSDVVEVLYFHGARRCVTCLAIEEHARDLVETVYAEEQKRGNLVFRSVDIAEEVVLAKKYEVAWSALILVDYNKGGRETVLNLTELAFGSARTAPERFKSELSARLNTMLDN